MEEIKKIESVHNYYKKRVLIVALVLSFMTIALIFHMTVYADWKIDRFWEEWENIKETEGLNSFKDSYECDRRFNELMENYRYEYYDNIGMRWELYNLAVVLGGASVLNILFYFYMSKMQLVVTDKRVYGRAAFGRRVDLPLDSISAVGTSMFKGIAVASSSGRIMFLGISNRDEIHKVISQLLVERQNHSRKEVGYQEKQSSTDELKKYKELLDSEVITQDEFDAKKKQLLGL